MEELQLGDALSEADVRALRRSDEVVPEFSISN